METDSPFKGFDDLKQRHWAELNHFCKAEPELSAAHAGSSEDALILIRRIRSELDRLLGILHEQGGSELGVLHHQASEIVDRPGYHGPSSPLRVSLIEKIVMDHHPRLRGLIDGGYPYPKTYPHRGTLHVLRRRSGNPALRMKGSPAKTAAIASRLTDEGNPEWRLYTLDRRRSPGPIIGSYPIPLLEAIRVQLAADGSQLATNTIRNYLTRENWKLPRHCFYFISQDLNTP